MRDRSTGFGGGRGGGGGGGGGRGRGRGGGGGGRNRRSSPGPPPPKVNRESSSRYSRLRSNNSSRSSRRSSSRSPPPSRMVGGPSRRSLSPVLPNRLRSPIIFHPSVSRGEREYVSRQSDHGMNHLTDTNTNTSTAFDDQGFDFHHKYMLPDHHTDFSDVGSLLPPSQSISIKDKGGLLGLTSSSGVGPMLVQSSVVLDDRSKRSYFSLKQQQQQMDSVSLNPAYENVGVGGSSSLSVGMGRYRDNLYPYDDVVDRERVYSSRDHVSFPGIPPTPPTQSRPFLGGVSSSSGLLKGDEYVGLYKGDLGGGGGGVAKFSDDPPLEYKGYSLPDPLRRSPPAREEHLGKFGYDEHCGRGRDDHVYPLPDDPYRKKVYSPRGEYRTAIGSSVLDVTDSRGGSSHKTFGGESSYWDQRHSFHRDTTGFTDSKVVVHDDFDGSSGSGYAGRKPTGDYEIPSYEESYGRGRVDPAVAYRERRSSPLLADDHPMYRRSASFPRESLRIDDDLDLYDITPERMGGRRLIVSNGVDGRSVHGRLHSPTHGVDGRSVHRRLHSPTHGVGGRSVHRRLQLPTHGVRGDGIWRNEERGIIKERRRFPSKRLGGGRPSERMLTRKLPRNAGAVLSTDFGGHRVPVKKRLRPALNGQEDQTKRKEDISRPYKVLKRSKEEKGPASLKVPDGGDDHADSIQVKKSDPLADSEEFKQQVHKAFLRFSKLLNESTYHQKTYRDDQKKSRNLLCCVCGRRSKEFVDIHSLLMHSYSSSKVGLKTEHLGFHKALCIHNDWNWLVAPDMGDEAYKLSDPSEMKTLKEDLILWPPIVIIHNSSIGNGVMTNEPKIVSNENMEEILKEMGFEAGKARVCRGKPANQSVLLVKFMPTLSGLQEAVRLHQYYADNNRGKVNFQHITSSDGNDAEKQVLKDEELLYGYMAVAEDLDRLDAETKKRCLVKSKKDIEAIADAPLAPLTTD